uniref:Capsid protein n=1 Tax=Porcine associated porprismacovirus TaxID=2496634 RepID=A0A482JSU5_9VIRU|nr:capsid protein [Porcine associated porprismacovirus]
MKFRFQSFVDVSTSATSMQVIQWSVGGADVVNRCRHLFGAYKYFKLGKISVKMVPASTLPVDPQGLSYAEDDPQTVDPRDQMNPGLVRITNGEDVFTNVSSLSADAQIQIYNAMMLDPRWSKFMLQSGFRRSAYPLYWQIGQLSQDKYPGATVNIPQLAPAGGSLNSVNPVVIRRDVRQDTTGNSIEVGSSARGLFQVGHRGRLGWLPTDYYQEINPKTGSTGSRFGAYGINNVPQVNVITCVLPKAYKTVYYYRVFITEEVLFTGLRSSPPVSVNGDGVPIQRLGIDAFTFGNVIPVQPGEQGLLLPTNPAQQNNGDKMP